MTQEQPVPADDATEATRQRPGAEPTSGAISDQLIDLTSAAPAPAMATTGGADATQPPAVGAGPVPPAASGLAVDVAPDTVTNGTSAPARPDRLEVLDRGVAPTRRPTRTLPGTVLLVGSSGGHLAQLQSVAGLWADASRSYVTFDTADAVSVLTGEQVTWAYHPTTRNVRNLVRNSVLAVRELRRRRPDVVVSTGAAVAFPFFLAARVMRIPTVYVEVYDRIDSPTLTGRLCRPVTSLFCVQWAEQTAFYKGSQLVGSLM